MRVDGGGVGDGHGGVDVGEGGVVVGVFLTHFALVPAIGFGFHRLH